jgi:hypothetical protein
LLTGGGGRLKQVAAGLAQMRIGVAVLTEMKFVNGWHPNMVAGYTIMCSKVASCAQGGVVLVWKKNNLRFEVKLVLFHSMNTTLMFQLRTGDERL